MKKTAFIILGIIVFLFLALLILPLVFQKSIENKAKKEIDNNTNAQVSFDRVSLSVFKDFPNPTISLHDLNIVCENEFAGDTLANIKEVAIEMSLKSLLFGDKPELKSAHFKNAKIDIEISKNGNANYDIFKPDTAKTTDSSTVNLAFDNIEITDGEFTYEDKLRNTYVKMEDIDHIGSGDFLKDIFDFSTITKIDKMTFHFNNIKYLIKKEIELDLIMEMNLKENKFSFKENRLRINHFQVGLEGFLTILENGYDMDLKLATKETEFKNILSLIPGVYKKDFDKVKTDGEIAFEGQVKGKYTYLEDSLDILPNFHFELKIKDGMFKVDTLPTAVNNIQVDLVVDNKYGILDSTVFDLKKLHVDMGKHPIDGRIRVVGVKNYCIDSDIIADMELEELESMYPIKGLKLKGKLDFELKAKGKYAELNDVIKEIPSFHLDMKLADGRVKFDTLAAIKDIQLHLLCDNETGKLENTILNFKSINLDMGGNPVSGYAKVEGYKNYLIDADIKANLNLADIEKMYPIKGLTIKGLFALDIKAKGEYSSTKKKFPSIDAKMNLTDGYVLSSDYPEPIENIHLLSEVVNKNGALSETKLSIEKLTYTMEGEPFEISGNVVDFEKYIYDLKVKGQVDLEKITKIYPIKNMQLAGIIDTDIETSGRLSDLEKGRYDKITSEGTIEVKHLKISGDEFSVPLKIKEGLLVFTSSKIILKKLEGNLGKGYFTLTGDLYNYMSLIIPNTDMIKGDLNLYCDTLDLNPWIAKTTVQKGTTDTSHVITSVFEVPRNVAFIFDSNIDVVLYEDMIIKKMKGDIKITDGILTLKETGFNSLNALFNISCDYNTQNVKHPLFDMDLEIQELDMNKAYKEVKLIRDLAPAMANTFGMLSISYQVKGELDNKMGVKTETLVGGGEVRIADAKVNGMKIFDEISKSAKKKEINDPHLKDLVIKTTIKNNQLKVEPFQMKISGFDAEIEGISDIKGTISYVVKLQLLMDKIKIPFHVTGTYDNPKVAMGKGRDTLQ